MKRALFSAFLVFCIIICTGCQQQSASSVASETIATEDSISESPVTEAEIESNIVCKEMAYYEYKSFDAGH